MRPWNPPGVTYQGFLFTLQRTIAHRNDKSRKVFAKYSGAQFRSVLSATRFACLAKLQQQLRKLPGRPAWRAGWNLFAYAVRAVGMATKQSPDIGGDCFASARNHTSSEVTDI